MYGVWIVACLAQPGDSIVLDKKAAARCVSKPPNSQWINYDLHDASYQFISTKSLQVRWACRHRHPKKSHSLQDYQHRIGNKVSDHPAQACICTLAAVRAAHHPRISS